MHALGEGPLHLLLQRLVAGNSGSRWTCPVEGQSQFPLEPKVISPLTQLGIDPPCVMLVERKDGGWNKACMLILRLDANQPL